MGTERKKQLILQLVGVGKGFTLELGLKGQRGKVILEDKIAKKKKKRKEGTFSRDSEDCHIATAESGAKGKKKRVTENKSWKKNGNERRILKALHGGSEVKASTRNAGDPGSIPGSGRCPGEGNGNPLQYSCLENPMEGGAW